jgi:hypothetical protein
VAERAPEVESPDFENGCFTAEADAVAMVIYHTGRLYDIRQSIYRHLTTAPVMKIDAAHYEIMLLQITSMTATQELINEALKELSRETHETVTLTEAETCDVCCWLTRMCVSDQQEHQQNQ